MTTERLMEGVLDLRLLNGQLQMLMRYQLVTPPDAKTGTPQSIDYEDRWIDVPAVTAAGANLDTAARFTSQLIPAAAPTL